MSNPFIPFQIATDNQFINRQTETKTILERVAKGASSGIVGNPHIGKSSLLRYISEPDKITEFVPHSEQYTFIEVHFQSFISTDEPDDFWAYVLEESIIISPETEQFFAPLLEKQTLDSRRLLSTFTRLGRSGRRVVLLIDEFDYLFNFSNFNTLDFLGPMRAIVMATNGLVLVIASRLSVAELNLEASKLKHGSDLFNYLEEIPLSSFKPQDVSGWLKKYCPDSKVIDEILSLAGYHPMLLQLAGETFYEADLNNDSLRRKLHTSFIHKAETQFQDVWNYLTPKAQVALVIFALDELGNRLPSGEKFSLEKAKKYMIWYQAEIDWMVRRGTLEVGPTESTRIGSPAFLEWIYKHKIVGTQGDDVKSITQWLTDKQYKLGGLLTQEEIDWLQKAWQAIPDGAISLAGKAIKTAAGL